MPDCIFCKIAAHTLPSTVVYEDDSFIAFLDIHPKAKGHTVLIPKAHYQWFQELPDELYGAMFAVAKKLATTLKEEQKADYIHLSIVGKDVPHVHVHLIPRTLEDKGQEI